MELLTNIIVEYLKHNKRLVVPKLGAFIVKQPSGNIIFSELMRNDDGVLRSLLVAYGINELKANGMIDRMVFEIRHTIGKGDNFVIGDFGEFSAGANNTIVFRQKREPKKIGGNIKPPVERLDAAKRKRQQANRLEQAKTAERTKDAKSEVRGEGGTRAMKRRRGSENENKALTKPDAYLRGLKYKNKKSKGGDDDYYGSDKRGISLSKRYIIMGFVAVIIGVAVWFVWSNISSDDESAMRIIDGDNSAEMVVTDEPIQSEVDIAEPLTEEDVIDNEVELIVQ